MSAGKIVWDAQGDHLYETGTKNGVLYILGNTADDAHGGTMYTDGVAWNGLTAVTASPEGGDANDIYADDIKYLVLRGTENFKGTIEAYTYPDEFAECDGSAVPTAGVSIGQQPRKSFGFSWTSTIGNDTDMDTHGYLIHLVWGASASPSEKAYQTINDSPEAITFSWEFSTVPVAVTANGTTYKPTAYMRIDSTKVDATKLAGLKDILYGKDATVSPEAAAVKPCLPTPAWIIEYMTPSGTP